MWILQAVESKMYFFADLLVVGLLHVAGSAIFVWCSY